MVGPVVLAVRCRRLVYAVEQVFLVGLVVSTVCRHFRHRRLVHAVEQVQGSAWWFPSASAAYGWGAARVQRHWSISHGSTSSSLASSLRLEDSLRLSIRSSECWWLVSVVPGCRLSRTHRRSWSRRWLCCCTCSRDVERRVFRPRSAVEGGKDVSPSKLVVAVHLDNRSSGSSSYPDASVNGELPSR